jgi:hypothetical protein
MAIREMREHTQPVQPRLGAERSLGMAAGWGERGRGDNESGMRDIEPE